MHAKNVPPTVALVVPDPSPKRKVVASDMDGQSQMYNDAWKTYKTSRSVKFPANNTKDLCPRVAQGVECIKNKNGRCEFGHKKISSHRGGLIKWQTFSHLHLSHYTHFPD